MKKATLILALVLLVTLAACSANDMGEAAGEMFLGTANSAPAATSEPDKSSMGLSGGGDYAYGIAEENGILEDNIADYNETGDVSLTDPNRKLIRTASVSLETTEFDESVANLEALCLSYQGFVESSSVYGASITSRGKQYRSANYSFRIPSIRYNEFLSAMGTIGNMTNKTQNSEDVTDTYYDIESRLKILEMRRDRLVGLLEKETNSKSIVDFENSLSETLYEIEKLTGSLKKYDSLVEYSSISVYLEEVEEYTEIQPLTIAPKTVGERIEAAFGDSAKAIGSFFVNLTVFLLGNILYLLIWGVVIAAAVIVTRKLIKRKNANKQEIKGNDGTNQP